MAESAQITLIICATILIGLLIIASIPTDSNKNDKNDKDK